MSCGSRRRIFTVMGPVVVLGLLAAWASGQAAQQQRPQLAEEAFKNIVVYKGVPVDEFLDTMGMYSASLTLTCSGCHVEESLESWDRYADDTPIKQTARRMALMVNSLNRNSGFRQGRTVTCWTCHQGNQIPESTPNLAVQYQSPVEDPNEVFDFPGRPVDPSLPMAAQIFDKFVQAAGGARASALNTIVGKGTYEGYDTEHEMIPFELYAKAPNQMTTIIRYNFEGNNDPGTKTFDGTFGWQASPDKPVPLMQLNKGNLDGARVAATVAFPSHIKDLFSQWQVSSTVIDERDVYIVMGTAAGKSPVKFYFDEQTSLLTRVVYYNDSIAGRVPTQLDFSDYRDVSGVKIPFHITTTWTNGLTNVELTEVQVNVPIDAARFARPAPLPVRRR